jgi:ERCC4-related helicase
MYSAGPFKWKPKACAADMLYAAMQPAIRFSKDECLDLPGVVYLDRHVPLSVAQNKFIKQMATDWLVKDGGVPVTAVHAASRVSKILQACSGVVKRDDGTYMHLETGSRIAEIMQIMDDSDGKVIVFCKFRGAIAHIVAELNKQLRKVLEAPGVVFCKAMTGDTTDRERAAIVDEFQDEDSMLRVLVAQPITAAHGLTLTAANAIVWYTPFEKAEYYIQGNERTDRPGQTRKTTVYHLSGSPFEDAVYASVAGMVDYESSMLDLYALASKSW